MNLTPPPPRDNANNAPGQMKQINPQKIGDP